MHTGTNEVKTGGLFSELATEQATLLRATEVPDIDLLSPGDMVICPDDWGVDDFLAAAEAKGVHVRAGRYRYEDETVGPIRARYGVTLNYTSAISAGRQPPPGKMFDPDFAAASKAAFAMAWDALSSPLTPNPRYDDAADHIPQEWVQYLPFPTLNPAQVEAAPLLLSGDHALVVAPTGAGKTMLGMIAALREILGRGGKAAWLVPQRSLTAELDRELDVWRRQGMKVVALSGETATDHAAARDADLWVATTEKFEALCRATSMRETVASIGTLIVDEIHLLGEPSRGPLLETLLARIRGEQSPVRIVGLSATATNADQIAEWLGAKIVQIAWRPTRLTQQVLTIPGGDRQTENRWRNEAAVNIAREVSLDGGSTLVFCGTKVNVRTTALAIAGSRGVDITGIGIDDIDAVHTACQDAGVGLHYSDWPHKSRAERDFRDRTTNVLVATSTLAAGVNTPARVVVVRDTSIGPSPMEVSMIQQMFGRAGRAGKEAEGWSFVLVSSAETGLWRQRLAAGYTIQSGIQAGIADHLLGEVVQGHVQTLRGAETWWRGTLAHFQGAQSNAPLLAAVDYLQTWHFVDVEEGEAADQSLKVTPLGALTSKMMVSVADASNLIGRLSRTPMPHDHLAAEESLIEVMSVAVGALASAPDAPQDQAAAVQRLLAVKGDTRTVGAPSSSRTQPASMTRPGTRVSGSLVSQAGLLLVARSPRALVTPGRQVAGVNRSLFAPAFYDTPRYFAWLAALGPLGAVPSWVSVIAHDLGKRVTHFRIGPVRGSGRLLALCERIARGGGANVADLHDHARRAGVTSPETWGFSTPPSGSRLTSGQYAALLADRVVLRARPGGATVSSGAAVFAQPWGEGARSGWTRLSVARGQVNADGIVAAFSGTDCQGSGWLDQFAAIRS